MSILSDIWEGVRTTMVGLKVTVPYIWKKPVTIRYPHERMQLPERTRNRLYVNQDDCIGCDQCSRACPVNCITIETAKAIGDDNPGLTSNGKRKALWVTRFDIDIAKCCYCGLCVYPCPTECIKMTDIYEFS
ncbi:MAG: NADH-quinone oxidoreductase subunit I, partial [bacterium]|nr:NADH-quinone oxidoreductase subunit I [Candidatus Kapabacteria bacterium]